MYEADGNEKIVLFSRPESEPARLAVDVEDYARMINEGWMAVEETDFFREPVDPAEFLQIDKR